MITSPNTYALDLPSGIKLRGYAEIADLPALLRVHDACREQDRLDPHSVCYRLPNLSLERYAQEIAIPDAAVVAITESGEIVAHGFMEEWGMEDRCYLWRVFVKPDWRGLGIGTALLHYGEAVARTRHGGNTRPALHLANATEHEQDARELLRNEGYQLRFISPELAFDDFANLPKPLTIPGIVIRPLQSGDAAAVARALCVANLLPPQHDDRFPEEELEKRIAEAIGEWEARVAANDFALSFAAWDGEQVTGAYLCQRGDDVGEIAQVAVVSPWRGRGIARALAMHSLHALHQAGCVTARLFTSIGPDETEPTEGPYAMYRKFGFYPIAQHLRFFKRMTSA